MEELIILVILTLSNLDLWEQGMPQVLKKREHQRSISTKERRRCLAQRR